MANKIVVGVSGGPDSMYLLHKLRNKKKRLIVAHVNYNFRAESNQDTEVVLKYCRNHKIIVKVLNVDEKILTKYKHITNVQSKARKIRFDFYQQIAQTYETKKVMLGHHKNDFIETAIMQEKRSEHLLFYGINKKVKYGTIKIYRPLLNIYKEVIINKIQKANVSFVIDKSNLDTKYERNDIRAKLSLKSTRELDLLYKHYQKINKTKQRENAKVTVKYDAWQETRFKASFFNSLTKEMQRHLLYRFYIREEKLFKINTNKVLGGIEFLRGKGQGKFRLADNLSMQIREGNVRVIEEK